MSMYLVTVDPGAESRIQPHSYFVDAPNPNAAYCSQSRRSTFIRILQNHYKQNPN